jgi:hypothetical protein
MTKQLKFREWLLSEDDQRGAKLGLYPSIADNMGQYPPLYMTPISADFILYYDIVYGKKPLKSWKPGIIDPKDTMRDEPHRPPWPMPPK